MKIKQLLLLTILSLLLFSCNSRHNYNVAISPAKKMSEFTKLDKIYLKYKDKHNKQYKLNLMSDTAYQFTNNLKLLTGKTKIDMAVINNNNLANRDSLNDIYSHIKVVLPVSSRILYFAFNNQIGTPKSLVELLEGKKVIILSYEYQFIKNILSDFGVNVSKIEFLKSKFNVNEPELKSLDSVEKDSITKIDYNNLYKNKSQLPYDVEIGFIPSNTFSKGRLFKFLNERKDFTLFSLDDYKMFNNGSYVEGFCLRNKYFTPYLLPKGTYGEYPETPILTLRQDFVLVSRDIVDDEFIYEFVKTALEETDLIDVNIYGKEFNNINFAFPMHEGTKRYLDKNAPTIFEKYGELMGKVGTGIGGFYTALMGFLLWRKRRRRRELKIDYEKVLGIQLKLSQTNSPDELNSMFAQLQSIQEDYHKKIIDRKILIDETLHIFFEMINKNEQYILEQLKSKSGD